MRTYSLGELVIREPEYGSSQRAIPIQAPDDVKYIRITDFDDDGIVPGNEFSTAENIEDRYRLIKDDVLFARSGSVGKTFIYTSEIGPSIFAGYCIRFQFDTNRVLPAFVYFYTKASRYQAWVRAIQRPAVQSNINKEEFKSFTVPVPTLDVQRKLVAEMQRAQESRRKKLDEANELLAGMDAVLLERLGIIMPPQDEMTAYAVYLSDLKNSRCDALYNLPRIRLMESILSRIMCQKKRLGQISPQLAGGATPSRGKQELYANDGIRFLRIMNVAPFEIKMDDIKYITKAVDEGLLGRSQLQCNDVVMTITGRVGTSAVVTPEVLPANINQHIVRIRLTARDVHPEYLVAYLNSSIGLALTNRGVTGGTRIAVDYEAIKNILIPIPEEKTQREIVHELQRRRVEARRLREEAECEWAEAKKRFEERLLERDQTNE